MFHLSTHSTKAGLTYRLLWAGGGGSGGVCVWGGGGGGGERTYLMKAPNMLAQGSLKA